MLGSLFRPLMEKWGKAPVLPRMKAEDYRLYLSDIQVLMDAFSLLDNAPRNNSSAEFLAEARDFFALCLALGDPMTVAALAPAFRPEDPSGLGGRILGQRIEALLNLQRFEEGLDCLDRYARLTPVPDPSFLHSCSARSALLQHQPEGVASGFRKALAAAEGDRHARLYEEWIWSTLELSDAGLADREDAEAVLQGWSEEVGTAAGSPEFHLARAALRVHQGDAAGARGILDRLESEALPPACAPGRHLLSARIALLEDRWSDARGAVHSAFQAGLDTGSAWAERGIATAGAALVRVSSDAEAMKQLLRELTEAKDWYLEAGHSSWVGGLALGLAEKIRDLRGDIGSLSLPLLGRAAEFHDIGKWPMPWCLLNRSLPLLAPELAQVRGHVALGESLLKAWGEPETAAVVGEHHERMNGEGYPHGGAFSCAEAAGLALSEAFIGACSATRKTPWPREMSSLLPEFKALRGLWFEPAALDALLMAAGEETEGIIRPCRKTP